MYADVYRNAAPRGARDTPFLLDVQANLLHHLATRVVVPLRTADTIHRPMRTLQPGFEVEGRAVVMDTPALVGAPLSALGERVGSLVAERDTILAAIDLLITGV
jgi:toxin CcdB